MNFFSTLHRSIFDAAFYKEAVGFSVGRVILYLIQLCLLCALVCGLAHTWYCMDSERGLPATLAAVLPGMEIRDSELRPHRATPYVPPSANVNAMLESFLNSPGIFTAVGDSFLVVDTGATIKNMRSSAVRLLLTSRTLEINPHTSWAFSLPLTHLAGAQETLVFSPEQIRAFLKRHVVSLAGNFIFQDGILNAGNILFSLFFLTLASFIFKVDKKFGFFAYFTIASFAVTPIAVGRMIVAISGTRLDWTWQVFIVAATIVMFRGVSAVVRVDRPQQRNELL